MAVNINDMVGTKTQKKEYASMLQVWKEWLEKQHRAKVKIADYMHSCESEYDNDHFIESSVTSGFISLTRSFTYLAAVEERYLGRWLRFLGPVEVATKIFCAIRVVHSHIPKDRKIICGIFDKSCEAMIRKSVQKYAEKFEINNVEILTDII